MLQKVASFIEKHQLLNQDEPLLIGFSGGSDSVALLSILQVLGYNCIAAHCNFHLRGNESNRDEQFVTNYCSEHGIRLLKVEFDTVEYARQNNLSIEMAARELRYDWFYEKLTETGAQAIAVAHHADDNIETMLLNLFRGTGLKGLTGMPLRNNKVVRPLLSSTRKEIEHYLSENNIQFVEDSTNAQSDYKRNKIRNEILPALETINPSIRNTLYESIERFEGTYKVFNKSIGDIKSKSVSFNNSVVEIDIRCVLRQADVPTILFELLSEYGFNASQCTQISKSLYEESGKQFFSEKYILTKDREKLLIAEKAYCSDEVFLIDDKTIRIGSPIQLTIATFDKPKDFVFSKLEDCIQVDANKIQFPLTLRKWNEGDFFYPFGMKNKKKLSDFFVDNKISIPEKNQTWILTSANDIIWIVGKRLDNRFRITENTKRIIEVRIENQ